MTYDTSIMTYDTSVKGTTIESLNDYCFLHILTFLPIKDRIRIQRVCKNWRRLASYPWIDIRELKLSFQREDRDQLIKYTVPILRKVLKNCGRHVTKIRLGYWREKHFLKPVFTIITQMCPSLQSLDLTGIVISKRAAQHLADHFCDLTHIGIGKCGRVECYEHISKFFSKNTKLRSVRFHCIETARRCLISLNENSVESLTFSQECTFLHDITDAVSKLKNLRAIHFIRHTRFSNSIDNILIGITNKHKLKTLSIVVNNYCDFQKAVELRSLCLFNNLTDLTLHAYVVTDTALKNIGMYCRNLSSIKLAKSPYVTDTGMKTLFSSLNLEKIVLVGLSEITEQCFSYIDMPLLKYLACCDSCQIPILKAVRLILKGSPNLESLTIETDRDLVLTDLIRELSYFAKKRRNKKFLRFCVHHEGWFPGLRHQSKRLLVDVKNEDCKCRAIERSSANYQYQFN